MKKVIKDKFPEWCDSEEQFDLCLTNDIDSLLSCAILNKLKGYRTNFFYNFTELYRVKKTGKPIIGVDMALSKGKCWDNHVTMLFRNDIYNKQSGNINNLLGVCQNNYHEKYAMSTLLTIMSYYDVPLPKDEEGKMILLAIDSSFLGHYSSRFKPTHTKYLQMLEYEELLDCLEQHDKQDFIDITNKYNLKRPIEVENKKLVTDINLPELEGFFNVDLSLPESDFNLKETFQYKTVNLNLQNVNKQNVFSLALIYKNTAVMSVI